MALAQAAQSYAKGYTLAAIGALLVGIFPFLFRELVLTVQSITLASFLLSASAWLMSLPFACVELRHTGTPHKQSMRGFVLLLCVMIFSGTAGNMFAAWSLEEVMPATMQFLQRIEVIIVILLGAFFLHETLTIRLLVATACALVGVFFIYRTEFTYLHWYSLLLPILSGAMFAVLNIAFKKAFVYYSPMTLNTIRLFFTSIFLGILSYSAWQSTFANYLVILLALLSAAVGPVGARMLYTYSFRYIEVGHSVLFTTLSPVATFFIQWMLLDIVPDRYELLGGIIIMSAVIYLIIPQLRKKNHGLVA